MARRPWSLIGRKPARPWLANGSLAIVARVGRLTPRRIGAAAAHYPDVGKLMSSPQFAARSNQPSLEALETYGISLVTGFVPQNDPLECLPEQYAAWEAIAPRIGPLIRARQLRRALASLPQLDATFLRGPSERERAMLLLTMFANGWVWGGAGPDLRIPANVAVPLITLAAILDRPPIVHYGTMLGNWRRVDPTLPVSADNATLQVMFLGGVDEDWFFMASLGVELEGAPMLRILHTAAAASHHADDAALASALVDLAAAVDPVLAALERMREWCDPHAFYHRVRPFLAGWPDDGAIYEGVSETPQKFAGGSAGQSSLIQALDAALGIRHGETNVGVYLRQMRRYMPVGHRRFVKDLERFSVLRQRAESGSATLRHAYDGVIGQIDIFRRRHIKMAHDYVAVPSGMAASERGTGGTAFVEFLQDARIATTRSKLGAEP